MSKKQRKEAKNLYTKKSDDMKEGGDFLKTLLGDLKTWRTNAINDIKDKNVVSAIELIKLRHGCLQYFDPNESDNVHGVGAIGFPDGSRLEKDDEVAAFVDESKTWILAEVKSSVSNNRYECIDIDDLERKSSYFARKQLIPLPKFTVDYSRYSNFALPKDARVLAIFPGTTCFYEGKVKEPPKRVSGFYMICFTDSSSPNNFSEPQPISERYVIPYKKDPVMYIRPEKRRELGIDVPKRSSSKKTEARVSIKKETSAVSDERDVPGPAPPPVYPPVNLLDDEYPLPPEKTKKKKKKAEAKPKVKIIRARVPEHKKRVSTRQFGKRRVKRKKNTATAAAAADGSTLQNPSDVSTENPTEEKDSEKIPQDEKEGSVELGSADDYVEDEENGEFEKKEKSDLDAGKKDEEEDEENDDHDDDGEDGDDEEDEEEEEKEKEKDSEDEENSDRSSSSESSDEESVAEKEPHDPQEGSSSHYTYQRVQSESESDSSDALSGITISDNERNRKGFDSDDEKEEK